MGKQSFIERNGIAVGFEVTGERLRFYSEPPVGEKPDFDGIGSLECWGDGVCSIKGTLGRMSIGHMAIIIMELNRRGLRWLYTHRTGGRTPLSKQIPEGQPFAGWFITDITKAAHRADLRKLVKEET